MTQGIGANTTSISTLDGEVTKGTLAAGDPVGADGVFRIISLTTAEYAGIGIKDPDCLYIITDA